MDGDSWLSWIPIVFLLCMAAYFAVAETAATSVSRIRLKARLDQGEQKAKKALYVQDNFDRAISAILIGTNIVHISTATLTTVLVTRTWGASWVALGTIVCTIAVFFAGEMLPKSIGKRYSERCALATAPSLCFFMRIFAPLAKLLSHIGEFFSNLSKGEPEITVQAMPAARFPSSAAEARRIRFAEESAISDAEKNAEPHSSTSMIRT